MAQLWRYGVDDTDTIITKLLSTFIIPLSLSFHSHLYTNPPQINHRPKDV
jgi:hypothetical protein